MNVSRRGHGGHREEDVFLCAPCALCVKHPTAGLLNSRDDK